MSLVDDLCQSGCTGEALAELNRLSNINNEHAAEVAWKSFMQLEGSTYMHACVWLYNFLDSIWGTTRLQSVIQKEWPLMKRQSRLNIAYTAESAEGITTEFAVQLFDDPSSTTLDRHIITASLLASAKQRKLGTKLGDLIPRIGKYDDAHRQAILEKFVSDFSSWKNHPSGIPQIDVTEQ